MQGKEREGKAREGKEIEKEEGKEERKGNMLLSNNDLSKFPTYSTNNLV